MENLIKSITILLTDRSRREGEIINVLGIMKVISPGRVIPFLILESEKEDKRGIIVAVTDERITKSTVMDTIEEIKKERPNQEIIIILRSKDLRTLPESIEEDYSSKVFHELEILREPSRCAMVPRMEVASEEEIKDMKASKVDLTKLPRLPMRDIMRRWYNFRKDEIIRVTSKHGIHHRIVR